MKPFFVGETVNKVREQAPLVHCITNYVTVNDCANALIACGGAPIMSDEPLDVGDIQTICGGLVLNIGTLNALTIEGMSVAGEKAKELGHPIVLDPVGAGASKLRTDTATRLLDTLPIAVVRGNMSECKALAGASARTRGVDVNPDDVVSAENLAESAAFARQVSAQTGAIVAITGAIDLIANADRAYAVRNGSPIMGKITGSGCMLSCIVGAYAVACAKAGCPADSNEMLDVIATSVAMYGAAGEVAASRMEQLDGNGSFRTYLLDALYNMDGERAERMARIEEV